MMSALLLLGSIIYRSARGTKHFGYHQLDKEHSEPMQRSVTSVHPKRHERRTDAFRMHGRSNISGHKVAPLAVGNKSEDLLINFDVDCSATPPTASTDARSQQPVLQSNADVLSLFDSSVAEKYDHLPPALGEKQRVPYDPFEISEDLKTYASQNATPLHTTNSVTPTASQPYDASSLQYSWSSFDSVSSQDVNDGTELGSPPPASSQDHAVSDRMFGSTTAGAAGASIKTGSDTDLLTYANLPLQAENDNKRRPVSTYDSRHSYSYSDCSRLSNRRRRRHDQNDQLASSEVFHDVNANSVVPRPVSIGDSVDWVSDAVSQISVRNTTASQCATTVSPALAPSTASWDEKSLSRRMKAAKKKMPNTGSVFYDDVDDGRGDATWMNCSRYYKGDNSPPPVPPRDYVREDTTHTTQLNDAIYANIGERNQSGISSDIGGIRQLAKVHPFVQASSDIYQNYSEFSPRSADSTDHSQYANMQDLLATQWSSRSSFGEATSRGELGGAAGDSAVQRVRRYVPAATPDECQAALVCCFGDVESAVRHLKVEQLTRLGIAPRERCRMLLEACGWNLESAGSVLLHELSTGSAV